MQIWIRIKMSRIPNTAALVNPDPQELIFHLKFLNLLLVFRKKVKCIRLGHPARVSEELQRHSLEALITTSEETALVRDIYAEIDALGKRVKRPEAGLEKFRFFIPSPVGFLEFFWVFWAFWLFFWFFYIFTQKREFLGFFSFKNTFSIQTLNYNHSY
jgi:hypothetical protein